MNFTLLFTFISVARTKNISKAAFELNQAQSTVSKRLRQLEEFLGQRLFDRKKGYKSVELTPRGEEFVYVAERWLSLHDEIERLRMPHAQIELRVAGLDSLNASFLGEIYRSVIKTEPTIRLSVQSHFFQNMYSHVSERKADVAFSFYHASHPSLRIVRLYSEPMVGLRRAEKARWISTAIPLSALPQEHEIYAPWSRTHDIWRKTILRPDISPAITIYPLSLVPTMMTRSEHWSIVPQSFAAHIQTQGPFEIFEIIPAPPIHSCYMLSHLHPSPNAALGIQIFEKHLMQRVDEIFGKMRDGNSHYIKTQKKHLNCREVI